LPTGEYRVIDPVVVSRNPSYMHKLEKEKAVPALKRQPKQRLIPPLRKPLKTRESEQK